MTKTTPSAQPEILVIGEVLFDIFPDYRRLGGAPFNFAVHMHKMGFATRFVSAIGEDENGRKIVEFMNRIGLSHEYLQRHPERSTGYVSVEMDNHGDHKFDIHQNVAYDDLNYTDDMDHLLAQPLKLIYFGTLIQRTSQGHATVQRILEKRHPTTLTFCDLNFRPGCYNREVVLSSLQQTDFLKLNHEELQEVGQFINTPKNTNTKTIITHLMNEYRIKTIVITRGADGSEWFEADSHTQTDSPEIDTVIDTVGAGDAFAAAAATGHLHLLPVDKTLDAASRFAARICGTKGALPTNDWIYEEFKNILPKKG